jgi:hypothetical protein
MDSGNEPSTGTTSPTGERQADASEPGSSPPDDKVPSLGRLELLGWDEV